LLVLGKTLTYFSSFKEEIDIIDSLENTLTIE
jgi:hypothetical protein